MTRLWSVRTYKSGDEQGILGLMRSSGIERTDELWFWEYQDNPLGRCIEVAECDGQIVGHMGLIPTCMKIGDRVIMGSQAVDLIVHPKFRHQGMFLEIGRMLTGKAGEEGIEVSYGFPNEPAHPGHLKYSWFDVCAVPQLVKPINMNKTVSLIDRYRMLRPLNKHKMPMVCMGFMLRVILAVIGLLSKIFNRTARACGDDLANTRVNSIGSFDDRIDHLWKKVSKYYPVIVIRNKEYLNWRYFKIPDSEYAVFSAEKNEEVLGYMVLRSRNESDLRFGYIVDIFGPPNDKGIIQSLILKAIDHFRNEKVDLVICWMLKNSASASLCYRILKYNGFIAVSSNPLIARINSPSAAKKTIGDPQEWYITLGDSDHI